MESMATIESADAEPQMQKLYIQEHCEYRGWTKNFTWAGIVGGFETSNATLFKGQQHILTIFFFFPPNPLVVVSKCSSVAHGALL